MVDGFLLIEIVDDRGVLAGEGFEALFPAGIGKAAAVEDEAAAVARFIRRQTLMKRKTENADDEIVGVVGEALQFFGSEHALERAEKRGKSDGKFGVMQEPAEIFEGVGDALQEMDFAFVEAAETVGAEGLHNANVNVGVIKTEEGFAIDREVRGEGAKIIVEKLLAKVGREVGFGVVEERGDVVLEGAFTAALVVNEIRLAIAEHNVAGLEVAIEEIIARGGEEKVGETAEIVFERVLVEGNAGEAKEIIFEIVEIPGDGLAVETGDGIADGIVEIAGGFDLEAGKDSDDFSVGFDDLRGDGSALAIFGEEFEERGVAEVFLEIGALIKSFGVDFGDGKIVLAKMFGEGEEGGVFFADVVEDADGGARAGDEADDFAAGAAEFALEGLDVVDGGVEVLLEERLENVDGHGFSSTAEPSDF